MNELQDLGMNKLLDLHMSFGNVAWMSHCKFIMQITHRIIMQILSLLYIENVWLIPVFYKPWHLNHLAIPNFLACTYHLINISKADNSAYCHRVFTVMFTWLGR